MRPYRKPHSAHSLFCRARLLHLTTAFTAATPTHAHTHTHTFGKTVQENNPKMGLNYYFLYYYSTAGYYYNHIITIRFRRTLIADLNGTAAE